MTEQIVVVRVHRNQAGTYIPFDKLYFFPFDKRALVPKVFNFALVLPVEKELLKELVKLRPKNVSHKHFQRNDDDLNQIPTIDDKPLDGRMNSDQQIKKWWEDNCLGPYNLSSRVVVIPVLSGKYGKKLRPRYLSAIRWFERQQGKIRRGKDPDPAISENAYLSTPYEEPHHRIRPLCSICPRAIQHLQGDCFPGQRVCYESLDLHKVKDPTHEEESASV